MTHIHAYGGSTPPSAMKKGSYMEDYLSNKVQTRTAMVEHDITDLGNGSAFCGYCGYHLGSDALNLPKECPDCRSILIGSTTHTNSGGSD